MSGIVEHVDVAAFVDLVDDEQIRRALPGMSTDARLQALAQCIWLREGKETAVFKQLWFDQYESIILDVQSNTPFVSVVLDYLFTDRKAKSLRFGTPDRESGHLIGARFLGPYMQAGLGFAWELTAADWASHREQIAPARVPKQKRRPREVGVSS